MEPWVTGEKGELWTYTEEWCCWSCYEGHIDGGATVGLSDAQGQLEGSDGLGWGPLEATFHIKCMQKMTVNISLRLMMLKFMSLTWSCCLNSKHVYPKGYPTWPLECLASISNGPHLGTFLAIQWLGLCTPNSGDMGLIPGWGTKILHASWLGQKKKKSCHLNRMYHIWNSVPDGRFPTRPFPAQLLETLPFQLIRQKPGSHLCPLVPSPISHLLCEPQGQGSKGGASTVCWVSLYLCGRRQSVFRLKEAYKLARQEMVGLGHRKGVNRAERTGSTERAEGGLVCGWPGVSLPGGRHRREGGRRVWSPASSCRARQAFTEPPSSACRPAVACHQSPRLVSNPSVATQTPALGPRGRPWLLASWFLNLCVWLWTLAAVVHPGCCLQILFMGQCLSMRQEMQIGKWEKQGQCGIR